MLQKVEVLDSGDSAYLEGEQLDKMEIEEINNKLKEENKELVKYCLLYTSPSPRDTEVSRMPSSA